MSIHANSSGTTIHRVTAYLVVPRVPELIAFLEQAFGAKELIRHVRADGSVQHAEVHIGPAVVMMGEPDFRGQTMPVTMHLDVNDVDAAFERAVAAGAKSVRTPGDHPKGGRMAGVEDLSGNYWYMASP